MSVLIRRDHALDNLRALAMLLGVLFHAAIAYSPTMTGAWLTAGGEASRTLDALAWFTHLWRMPLFFLISGYFSMLLLRRRGVRGFLRNRALRIALPFVVFMPVILMMVVVTIGWAMQSVEHPGPLLQAIIDAAERGDTEPPPFSTMHLWFLYNLCQFVVFLAVLFRLGVFDREWWAVMVRPAVMLLFVPLLLLPALASQPAPHPAPEQLVPQLWSFGFYGVFFLLGAVIHDHPKALAALQPFSVLLLVASILLYTVLYPFYGPVADAASASSATGFTWHHLRISLIAAYVAMFMTVSCLTMARRWLTGHHPVMRYLADAAYWIYLTHLPLLLVLQFALMDREWGAWPEFLFSVTVTFALGLLSYAGIVRWTPIGLLLNGRRVPLRRRPTGRRWDIDSVWP